MPVTFIGDVHGWSDRLDRLLPRTEGRLIFLGDLIDRGPDAPGVLDRVHNLCDQGRAACLMGNHEWAMLRALRGPASPTHPRWSAWPDRYGGQAVLAAYGAADLPALHQRLGRHLPWLEALPWCLEGMAEGRRWIAVHAGLDPDEPAPEQLARLSRGWDEEEANLDALFSKRRALAWPDCGGACLVSGHTPITAALVTAERILCDTSGGQPDRPLSGVIWPEERVVTS
jgi:serine/threonine protein phosphatase 1